MARGGVRKGSGRKTSWVSGCEFGDTKLIRVPKKHADQLLAIAHKLDAGQKISDDVDFDLIKKIIERWIAFCNTFSDSLMAESNDLSMVKSLLKELILICRVDMSLIDLVTKSENQLDQQVKELNVIPITQSFLSKRLGISPSKIRESKGKTGDKKLAAWSIDCDPDRIAWKYDSKTKKYIPATELSIQQKSSLLKWISENSD
jgi:hypothetical protein